MLNKYLKLSKDYSLKNYESSFKRNTHHENGNLTSLDNNYLALNYDIAQNENQLAIIDQSIKDNNLLKLTQETKQSLENIVNKPHKNKSFKPTTQQDKTFIKYTPNETSNINTSSNNKQKIISISDIPVDPCLPTKFKHRKMQKDLDEPKVPILHSPTRKLTTEELKALKIPPCISNWKNAKGYTIPLHMRLSVDMRSNKDIVLSDKFAKFSDVINLTERQLRKDIEERNRVKDCIHMMDTFKKEQELLDVAEEARKQKLSLLNSGNTSEISKIPGIKSTSESFISNSIADTSRELIGRKRKFSDNTEISELTNKKSINTKTNTSNYNINKIDDDSVFDEVKERNKIRELKKKQITREVFNEGNNKYKDSGANDKKRKNNNISYNDNTRDLTENNQSSINATNKEFLIDSRLYNNTSGLESGFKFDDEYDLYDKPLFQDRSKASLYRPPKNDDDYADDKKVHDTKKIMEKIKQRGKLFQGANEDVGNSNIRIGEIEFKKQGKYNN